MQSGSSHRPRSTHLARFGGALVPRARREGARLVASEPLERRPRRELGDLPPPAGATSAPAPGTQPQGGPA